MSIVVEWGVIFGFAGIIITVVGGVIARDRQLSNMIHNNHDEAAEDRAKGDERLHERINRIREEMAQSYVRREDLERHIARIEATVTEMRREMKEDRRDTNARLDAILDTVRKH